ncbi:MAG: TIGR00159 family protein [Deltaproteobacteria bacterium]|nr:TIGR00159 family protein [Deltaproteobacteria bacterium]
MEGIFKNFSTFEFITSLIDILLIYYILYRILLLMKGTRAIQMLVGVILVAMLFFISKEEFLNLSTLNWMLEKFVSYIILIVIILFQSDIRRALTQVGKNPLFLGIGKTGGSTIYEEIIKAAIKLSGKRIGALIVIEKEADLSPYSEEAVIVDAKVTKENIFSIFIPSYENPLHDGAIIIRKGRISHAGCFLPLTDNPKVEKTLGTRHRAAIGISEVTDAVVIVVSEESGTISLANHGKIFRGMDADSLSDELFRHFGPRRQQEGAQEVNTW